MAGRVMGTPRSLVIRRRLALALPLALVGLLLRSNVASADLLSPQSGGSPNADSIDTLYWLVFGLGIIVFVGVYGVLIYSLFKYRARKGAVAAQIHGNTKLEIGWTVGAAVILVFIAVFTFATLPSIRNPPNSDASVAQAAGADGDNNPLNNVFAYEQMVVPAGVTVTLRIHAQDVAHSWWVPELGGKFDAIPKHTNYTWFKVPADKAGTTFRGQCAELCGRGHANMIAQVKAVTPAQFEAWYDRKKTEIKASDDAAATQRKQVDAGQNP
jgi:cytochrome c oxidase subunit II